MAEYHERGCSQLLQICKRRFDFAVSARMQDRELFSPKVGAAVSRSRKKASLRVGLVGSTSTPTTVAVGNNSCSSSSRFGPMSTFKLVTPVRLLPGRLRLATNPASTGSIATAKTIGMVAVAAFAASAEGVPPAATITETLR